MAEKDIKTVKDQLEVKSVKTRGEPVPIHRSTPKPIVGYYWNIGAQERSEKPAVMK